MSGRRVSILVVCASLATSCGDCACREAKTRAPVPAAGPTAQAPEQLAPARDDERAPPPYFAAHQAAVREANRGALDDAIAQLEEILETYPHADAVRRDLAVLYGNHAIALLNQGRLAAADRVCARALKIGADSERLHEVCATASYRRGMDTDSLSLRKSYLEAALEVQPTHAPSLVALGRLLEEDNDLEGALDAFARAKDSGAEVPGLDDTLERLRRQSGAERDFKAVTSTHFAARFEGYADEKLAWTALEILERAYFTIDGALGLRPDSMVTVVIYTGGQYAAATDVPDWTAGLYDGKIRVREGDLIDDAGRLERLLFHEYTHAAVARAVEGRVPAWLHEGLASLMEPGHAHDDDALLAAAAAADELLPLATLERSFVQLSDGERARLAYAQARGLVALLLETHQAYGLNRVFARMNEGESFEQAFSSVTYSSPQGLFARWRDGLR